MIYPRGYCLMLILNLIIQDNLLPSCNSRDELSCPIVNCPSWVATFWFCKRVVCLFLDLIYARVYFDYPNFISSQLLKSDIFLGHRLILSWKNPVGFIVVVSTYIQCLIRNAFVKYFRYAEWFYHTILIKSIQCTQGVKGGCCMPGRSIPSQPLHSSGDRFGSPVCVSRLLCPLTSRYCWVLSLWYWSVLSSIGANEKCWAWLWLPYEISFVGYFSS